MDSTTLFRVMKKKRDSLNGPGVSANFSIQLRTGRINETPRVDCAYPKEENSTSPFPPSSYANNSF